MPSVPTSVIQAPSTASPISSGGGSPSGGEDNYFNELYNLGVGGVGSVGGGYSGQSGLESPHRRKKMKKQRNPDGPDGCPSGKRKNREGKRILFNFSNRPITFSNVVTPLFFVCVCVCLLFGV